MFDFSILSFRHNPFRFAGQCQASVEQYRSIDLVSGSFADHENSLKNKNNPKAVARAPGRGGRAADSCAVIRCKCTGVFLSFGKHWQMFNVSFRSHRLQYLRNDKVDAIGSRVDGLNKSFDLASRRVRSVFRAGRCKCVGWMTQVLRKCRESRGIAHNRSQFDEICVRMRVIL